MYYGSGTVDRISSGQHVQQCPDADAVCALTRWLHFSEWNMWWLPSWKYGLLSEIWLPSVDAN